MKKSRKTDASNRSHSTFDPFIGNLRFFCVFLSVSPFYSLLILKPDMIRNSFRSVFLHTLLEKALRKQAVKDLTAQYVSSRRVFFR